MLRHTPISAPAPARSAQRAGLWCLTIIGAGIASFGPVGVAKADPKRLTLTATSDLQFGSFAIVGSGSRTVSATGTVTGTSIMSTEIGDTGPAQFDLAYDRGNNGRKRLDLVIEIVLSPVGRAERGGLSATVSAFDSTIPGYPRIVPGKAVRIAIPDCRSRICSTRFAVGGRIDITRNYGGGTLDIPLLFDATVISER